VLVVALLGMSFSLAYSIFKPFSRLNTSSSQDNESQISKGPTPTPTPTYLKPGKETYTVSQASEMKGPKITSVTFDPHDPQSGSKQTISLTATSKSPVKTISIEFASDNKKRTLELSRVGGSDTDGQWETSWTTDDTILYKYILTIISEDANSISKLIIAPRS
jgi:hypothetical protein